MTEHCPKCGKEMSTYGICIPCNNIKLVIKLSDQVYFLEQLIIDLCSHKMKTPQRILCRKDLFHNHKRHDCSVKECPEIIKILRKK